MVEQNLYNENNLTGTSPPNHDLIAEEGSSSSLFMGGWKEDDPLQGDRYYHLNQ
jgi:hypothetical protein